MNYFNAGCIPQSYWLSTSSNDIIHILLENANDNMKDILKDFLNGKTYEAIINTNIVYPDINGDEDTLLSFLVLTGYLKAEDIQYEEGMCVGNLSIPNKEISIVYKKEILNQIKDFVSSKLVLNLRRAIMNGKGEFFSKLLNDLIYNSISYMDAHEDYYHGIMLGICALFSETHYLESNRESGEGRFDLMLEPKNNKYPAVIMEFKVADKKKISALKKEEDIKNVREIELQKASEIAIKQIESNNYKAKLKERGIEKIYCHGIGFLGKYANIRFN